MISDKELAPATRCPCAEITLYCDCILIKRVRPKRNTPVFFVALYPYPPIPYFLISLFPLFPYTPASKSGTLLVVYRSMPLNLILQRINLFLALLVLVTVVLYFGQPLLTPLFLGALFAMLMAPLCRRLDKKTGRVCQALSAHL